MSTTTAENILTNTHLYDLQYGQQDIDQIVAKVRNLRSYLDDAQKTDTSWHGFYKDDFAERIANKRVLELGSGDGLNALIMAALGAEVVAIDISKESERIIKNAAAVLNLHNIEAISGNFSDLEFGSRSFDYFVGKDILHHLVHELEAEYLAKAADLLKLDGEARFVEPAVNSAVLDQIRWIMPVRGRPSVLHKSAFQKWKERDAHPIRDNSSEHFLQLGGRFFHQAHVEPYGSLERLCRIMPKNDLNRRYRRWAHRVETSLPDWFRHTAARAHLIVYRHPLT